MRVSVPLKRAYRLINHGPTTLITSAAGERRNVMAAAWVMPIDFDPPKLCAVIAQDTYTRELVEQSGELTVNVPTAAMVDATWACGSASGRDQDKLANLLTAPASLVTAPLIEGCAAWLECRVVPEPAMAQRYDLFVAEVVAAWADDALFVDGEWRLERPATRSLHHLARGHFLTAGESVRAGSS
jgi:flavin reductase (DIM6/NTAB) family NADH-FMN oxidoreductase RutF